MLERRDLNRTGTNDGFRHNDIFLHFNTAPLINTLTMTFGLVADSACLSIAVVFLAMWDRNLWVFPDSVFSLNCRSNQIHLVLSPLCFGIYASLPRMPRPIQSCLILTSVFNVSCSHYCQTYLPRNTKLRKLWPFTGSPPGRDGNK